MVRIVRTGPGPDRAVLQRDVWVGPITGDICHDGARAVTIDLVDRESALSIGPEKVRDRPQAGRVIESAVTVRQYRASVLERVPVDRVIPERLIDIPAAPGI